MMIPNCLKTHARRGVRIVRVKNPSVASLIRNQRSYSRADVVTCSCAVFPYPRIGGHVQFRLQELDDIHPLLCNANNVPKLSHPDREGLLLQEIKQGLEGWGNWRGEEAAIERVEVEACLSVREDTGSKYLDMRTVCGLKKQLEGLVLTPLDRNLGETLVLCPRKYYEAMLQLFVMSAGYRVIREPEGVVMEAMRCEVLDAGLTKLAQWDKKGKFGKVYVMPKHKDLTRFRPIRPTYSEPTVRGCGIVAKALNHLLFSLPQDWHFNLRSLARLVPRLDSINSRIARRVGISSDISAMSYDIKDMFSKLPHQKIVEAVDWVVHSHVKKGRSFVRVNSRGRGCSFGRTTGDDYWRSVPLQQILTFVQFELNHTYMRATGVLLRQTVGIPMGKSTSPPLTCILCAFAGYKFLRSLGACIRDVFGIRLMDDVSLIVLERRHCAMKVERIQKLFIAFYPKNLQLKRTDDDLGAWDFLGTQIRINALQPFVTCCQVAKNECTIWHSNGLEFKNGQSYCSWGCKQQKGAVVTCHLHRIDRNTNDRTRIPRQVLSLVRKLRLKDFPTKTVERIIKHFAKGRDCIWNWTVHWLYPP
ncbi:hypothetical protein CBR_g8248 [Chara braunii]|uniref:Reverse transcriptase domain-containing protein n=1 Tax=Chara braunii TaxID=69332 RepID=A0A388KLN5_CHABU|nr:hypothetical protein CBR_g8248 [Chara braunii]|eukprot:GBG70947.1 hypothetical protein CBR_g8248 [Chara braunii]